MAKETKIGLVVIGLLVTGLGGAIYTRLSRTDAAEPAIASAAAEPAVAEQKPDAKPTLVLAEPEPSVVHATASHGSDWTPADYRQDPTDVAAPSARYAMMPAIADTKHAEHPHVVPVNASPTEGAIGEATAYPPVTPAELPHPEPVSHRHPRIAPASSPAIAAPRYGQPAYKPLRDEHSPQDRTFQEPSRYQPAAAAHELHPHETRAAQYQQSSPSEQRASQTGRFDGRTDRLVQPASGGEYVVRPNDNFWTISKALYGTGDYFKALTRHNDQRHPMPDRLAVGDKVLAPSKLELMERFPHLCPKQRGHGSSIAPVSSRPLHPGRVYEVKQGDTLFDIARYELGDGSRWVEIYQLNQQLLTEDFDYVKPGTKLRLPGRPKRAGQPADRVTRQPTRGRS